VVSGFLFQIEIGIGIESDPEDDLSNGFSILILIPISIWGLNFQISDSRNTGKAAAGSLLT